MTLSRRRVLELGGLAGTLGLAGCADALDGDETPTPYPPAEPVAHPWPAFRRDQGNTAATEASGPTTTPTEYWSTEKGGDASPVVTGTRLYCFDGVLYALSIEGATTHWEQALTIDGKPVSGRSPTVHDGTVYVGTAFGTVAAFDAEDGERRWQNAFHRDEPAEHTPYNATIRVPPTVADGTVFVSTIHRVYALSATDGSVEWRFEDDLTPDRVLAVDDERLYVTRRAHSGPEESKLTALSVNDGSEQWTHRFERAPSAPVVRDGAVFVTTGYDENTEDRPGVYALSASDGTPRWTFGSAAPETSTPTGHARYSPVPATMPAVGPETLVVGVHNGDVYAVSTADGGERWQADPPDGPRWSPVVTDETVYVGSDSSVAALALTDGSERWEYDLDGPEMVESPAVAGDRLYVSTRTGVVALAPE